MSLHIYVVTPVLVQEGRRNNAHIRKLASSHAQNRTAHRINECFVAAETTHSIVSCRGWCHAIYIVRREREGERGREGQDIHIHISNPILRDKIHDIKITELYAINSLRFYEAAAFVL